MFRLFDVVFKKQVMRVRMSTVRRGRAGRMSRTGAGRGATCAEARARRPALARHLTCARTHRCRVRRTIIDSGEQHTGTLAQHLRATLASIHTLIELHLYDNNSVLAKENFRCLCL